MELFSQLNDAEMRARFRAVEWAAALRAVFSRPLWRAKEASVLQERRCTHASTALADHRAPLLHAGPARHSPQPMFSRPAAPRSPPQPSAAPQQPPAALGA